MSTHRSRLVLVLTLVLAASCSRQDPKAKTPEPRAVRLVSVEQRSLPRLIGAVGTLAAQDRAELSFRVPGRLEKLYVDLGSSVATGDVVAQLEPTDYRLRLERARAALTQARARLGLPAHGDMDDVAPENTATVKQASAKLAEATAQLNRSKKLLEEGVLSPSSFDVVEATYKVAESQYNDALEEVNNRLGLLAERRSDLRLAEEQLRETTLSTPFGGAIQQRRAGLGEYLAAGAPVMTLVKLHPIRMRVDVPEREAPEIAVGQDVTVRVEGEAKDWKGRVSRISPALEEASRSLVVEAEIPNPTGELRPGAFAHAEITVRPSAPSLVVPSSAVVVFAGIEKVVTVKDGKAVEKPVVTGRRSGDLVELTSGVERGMPVVVKPGNLATGVPVVEEAASGGATATPAEAANTE